VYLARCFDEVDCWDRTELLGYIVVC